MPIESMTRITVEINDEWLDHARQVLGTGMRVATINEALRLQALRLKAAEIIDAFDSVPMDFAGSAGSFRFAGGRDLSALEDKARDSRVA